ncbi:BTAD domain-containing putative transcriptional regulator [Streptomyces sp. NPDC050164]|uniref:BTAD domain-containing putative transcriptional regulator n=1 Tax=Streptomyces sp. NPDC050164 TaxID=3365605 RepID=UPI0037B9A39E
MSWEPLDEPSHLLLMRAFVEIGAPSRATELFRDLRRRLRRELGVEPAPELAAVTGQPAYGS